MRLSLIIGLLAFPHPIFWCCCFSPHVCASLIGLGLKLFQKGAGCEGRTGLKGQLARIAVTPEVTTVPHMLQ